MTLSEQITLDLKAAMKGGDKIKLETLRTVRAQFIELSKRGNDVKITPDEELSVLLGAIKKRKEAIDLYQQAGRKELVHQESRELEILQAYLPKQLSREEAEEFIKGVIQEVGAATQKDFGRVMGKVMKEMKGKMEGSTIQELVKKHLGA